MSQSPRDIFLERFPYKNIISNVIVDEDGIEKLIKMINDSLYMPGIEFVVIPTITPGINLSDITEEQLNALIEAAVKQMKIEEK